MDLNHLREFTVLAEINHYTKAAQALGLTKSTLSRHIQLLEKELEGQLFKRTSQNVTLSDFGKEFLPYALRHLAIEEEYLLSHHARIRRRDKIIVGGVGGLAPYNIGKMISRFKHENEGLNLDYIQVALDQQLELLRNNECDFLLTGIEALMDSDFNYKVSIKDYLVAVVDKSHALAGYDLISLEDLKSLKLALIPPLADIDGCFMKQCKSEGFEPEYTIVDNHNTLDNAMISGTVVILPRYPAVYFASDEVKIIGIEPFIVSELVIGYRKTPPLTPGEERFLDFMTSRQVTPETRNKL